MQILVAEDDVTSRTILVAILQKWGFCPVAAADGNRAWKMMQGNKTPLLVILDWEMPGLNGLEVCRQIRAESTQNPPYIIILTAKDKKNDIVQGLDAGANDFISKPYDNDELQARLNVGRRMVELQAELLSARDALAHEAMHDALTGALNRRAIFDSLNKELKRAERNKTKLSIGLGDIDYFKQVNDTYGHQAGDKVLCGFVQVIQSCLRTYDFVGRYGGEEFLVVAPDSDGSAKEALYERLRSRVADLCTSTPSGEIGITVSIGVAGAGSAATVEALLAAADAALYRAKDDGRNRVCYAS